jgi:hypothetical protein
MNVFQDSVEIIQAASAGDAEGHFGGFRLC